VRAYEIDEINAENAGKPAFLRTAKITKDTRSEHILHIGRDGKQDEITIENSGIIKISTDILE
jgi:hypothetical protein